MTTHTLIYLTLESTQEGTASYTHIHEIIKGLKKRGWDITLYQPSYAQKSRLPRLLGRLIDSIGTQIKLICGFQRGSILYIRGHYLAFPTTLFAKIFKIHIFHEINGPYADVFITYPQLRWIKSILIWLLRKQYQWATGLIAVTDELSDFARKESCGVETVTISNGANIDIFHPDAPDCSENLPSKYAIFFGGLSAWHGVGVMLDALSSTEWPDDVHLVVIGDGPALADLQKGPSRNGHLLHVLGRRPYIHIPSYVKNSLCGLIPIINPQNRSMTGLVPLKLFETMACGVPVLVTNFPGQADIVRRHHCGLVIEPYDAESLAKSVGILANDLGKAKQMGLNGAEAIIQYHSWDKRSEDTDRFLNKSKK